MGTKGYVGNFLFLFFCRIGFHWHFVFGCFFLPLNPVIGIAFFHYVVAATVFGIVATSVPTVEMPGAKRSI
jgi:hypothetical protein